MIPFVPPVSMHDVLENSFKDYHVKGFDYVCIRRTPTQTVKLYFFDGDVSKMPEVVNPHDHRYDFDTIVVAGRSQNVWFSEATPAQAARNTGIVFNRFMWETPLNGGQGFTHVGETRLVETSRKTFKRGTKYGMTHKEIHTIRMLENESVLCLIQHEDRVGEKPTLTFVREDEAPSLNGLYSKFTPDRVLDRLKNLRDRVPGLNLPQIV